MATQRQRKRLAQRIQQARRQGTSSAQQPPKEPQDPQIGYFAFHGLEVLCDGDGCVIAGSRPEMRRILQRMGHERMTIRGTTFSEIWGGLQKGAAYCFDEQAYHRFRGPARQAGAPLEEQDFSDPGPLGMHFVRIQFLH